MKTALKELFYHKKRYLLLELIVILLLFMVLFLSGLVSGLGRAVSSAVENLDGQTFILSDASENLLTVSSINKTKIDKLKSDLKGEDLTSLDVFRTYLSKKNDDEKLDVVYFALDNDSFFRTRSYRWG